MSIPETASYREIYKNFPYQDLLNVRDQLIRDIRSFESDKTPWLDYIPVEGSDSPYTEYMINLLHLSEISLMLVKAYPDELSKIPEEK